MAGTADLIRGGIQQAAAGKRLDSDTISSDGPLSSDSSGVRVIGEDEEVRAENSTTEDLLSSSEDTPEDSTDETDSEVSPSEAKSVKPGEIPDKEVITVTDEKGRRKVEIDYTDREAIKKAHLFMHGARKWQAERDQALNREKDVSKKFNDLQTNWNELNRIFNEDGVEALVDMLAGRKGAFTEHVKGHSARQEFLRTASPEEVEAFNAKEAAQKSERELAKMRRENEEFRKSMETKNEETQLESLKTRVGPVFNKYRFADKLGNEEDEQLFDEMLWNSALKRLEPFEEQGLEITSEMAEREFRTVATALRRRVEAQANKKAARNTEQKKREATENVQMKVKSGYKQGGVRDEARDLINQGNLTGLLKGWSKYGSVFQGKK